MVNSVGTREDENIENNREMGIQQKPGPSQENSGNISTDLIRSLLESVQSQLLNSMQGMKDNLEAKLTENSEQLEGKLTENSEQLD